MFFELSKILGFFAIPSNLLVVIALIGALLLLTRFARAGRRAMVAGILALAFFGFSPVGNWLILPLEERFPRWSAAPGEPTGIIILGGSVDEGVSAVRDSVALNEAAERLTAAVALARRYPQARVVFSGGSGLLFSEMATEAESRGDFSWNRAYRPIAFCSKTNRATRQRMRFSAARLRSRKRASAGCSSRPPFTCRARLEFSGRSDSASRLTRLISARAAAPISSDRSIACPRVSGVPTSRCANGPG